VSDGKHLWTNTFDEKFTDILTVEDKVSERVAEALALKLSGDEKQRLIKSYTNNAEAYQLYLRGRYLWNQRNEEALDKSIEYFHQAIGKDPNYALAYLGLADCYNVLGNSVQGGLAPRDAFPKAKAAALRALELDESLAEAHASLGFVATLYDWEWTVAEKE